MLMETYPEIMTDSKINESFNLRVTASEKRSGLFVIHPIGSINTNTYSILKKELEWILESWPEIILFDMKQVNYVNFRGLRVILKTIIKMNLRKGKVYLTNLQPEIKEMFDVMNDALPEWFFGNRKQLEIYLDAIHNNCSGNHLTEYWIQSLGCQTNLQRKFQNCKAALHQTEPSLPESFSGKVI
jgi:anti-sigma B factor antagonist